MNGGMAMSSYKDYKTRAKQNLEVKAEYDVLQPEYDFMEPIIVSDVMIMGKVIGTFRFFK